MAFSYDTIIGAAPLQVQFTDTTAGSVVAWYWQFGDAETSTEQNPIHTYTEEGRYTVSLEVTYADTSTEEFEIEDLILVDEVSLEAGLKCLRFATESNEGFGWSEFTGDDMATPMDNNGALTIEDDDGQKRDIIIDKDDFSFYEIDTCDRYINTRPSPLDKGSTEIAWEKHEKEEVLSGPEDNKDIKHEGSNISIQPADESFRGTSGYTVTGQRTTQKIDLEAYTGGEKTTPAGRSESVVEGGKTTFTGVRVKGNRVQMVVKGDAGEIRVVGHSHKFLSDEGSPTPAKRLPGDYSQLKELATDKLVWLTRGFAPLLNRVTGVSLSGGTVTTITGPDSRSSGFLCTESVELDNSANTAECTIVLWSKDADGSLIAGLSTFNTYGDTVSGWTLYYKRMTTGISANLEIVAGSKFDVRVYSKRITEDAIMVLYNDINLFSGKKVMPL